MVVVFGGTGFLGRHVCTALHEAGADLTVASRRPAPLGRWVPLDLTSASDDQLGDVLDGADVVVNASGTVWQQDPEAMRELNVAFVRRLTTALHGRRLVHLGSAYEYRPAGEALTEDHPTGSDTAYGRTKLQGSRIALDAGAIVLRVAVATGPGVPPASLPGVVVRHLLDRAERLTLAPLRGHRDFVDVRDIADAVVAATRSGLTGAVNIGSGTATPVREVVDTLMRLADVPLDVVEDGTAPVRAEMPWLRLDVTRARDLLGWQPRRSLTDSLRDLLRVEELARAGAD